MVHNGYKLAYNPQLFIVLSATNHSYWRYKPTWLPKGGPHGIVTLWLIIYNDETMANNGQ